METIKNYLPYLKGYDFTGKIQRLAKEYEGRIKVLKVDVDKNRALAEAANIRSIPTLFFIDIDGNIERTTGGMPYGALAGKAQSLLLQ